MSTGVRGRGCRNWAIAAVVALVLAGSATVVLLRARSGPSEVWLVPPVPSASEAAYFGNLRPSPGEARLDGYFAGPSEVLVDGTIVEIEVQAPNSAWDDFVGWLTGRGRCWFEAPRRYVATGETCSIKGVEWRKFAVRTEAALDVR